MNFSQIGYMCQQENVLQIGYFMKAVTNWPRKDCSHKFVLFALFSGAPAALLGHQAEPHTHIGN